MKKITSILFLLFILLFSLPHSVNAAGSFTCKFVHVSSVTTQCVVDTNSCNASIEHNDCASRGGSGKTQADCETGPSQCIAGAASSAPGSSTSSSANTPLRCNGGQGLDTAIGCIPIFDLNGPSGFMAFVIGWGVGIAGGIAFLLILYSGFQIMTSSGNPQKLQAGKELLGAAVSGLLLLIFSAFILRVVGVDILKIFT